MSKKILTEELILKRLKKDNVTDPTEISHENRILKIKEIYDCSIISDWENCDAYFYNDTTADGYEIWIATEREDRININEDVYYYDSQWFEKLADYLRDGCTVYIDSYSQDEYGFEEVMEALYEEWYMEIYEKIENELEDEGYSYPKSE